MRLMLVATILLVYSVVAGAQEPKPAQVRGYWEFKIEKDGKKQTWRVRIDENKLFEGEKQIGRIQTDGPGISTLFFTDHADLKGNIVIRLKEKSDPPLWSGRYTRDGTTWKFQATLKRTK